MGSSSSSSSSNKRSVHVAAEAQSRIFPFRAKRSRDSRPRRNIFLASRGRLVPAVIGEHANTASWNGPPPSMSTCQPRHFPASDAQTA